MNAINEIPLIINKGNVFIYGILRTSALCKHIVILTPALTGNRLGPQNIFVEISRQLVENETACFCVELPPAGDSYDLEPRNFAGEAQQPIFEKYTFYLDIILSFLAEKYAYSKVFLGSISVGCLPVLHYSQKKGLAGVILLSPNHFDFASTILNKRNLRSYFYKAFQPSTWKKLVFLQLNFKNILGNILSKPKPAAPGKVQNLARPAAHTKVPILCIFGEKDQALVSSQKYWMSFVSTSNLDDYKETVIGGSDHSFFGWPFKVEVCNTIADWVNHRK